MAGTFARWNGLPDPRHEPGKYITVEISNASLCHIIEKHIHGEGEPWVETVPTALHIENVSEADPAKRQHSMEIICRSLEDALRRSFQRPLVLLSRGASAKSSKIDTWLAVLPSGARMVLRSNKGVLKVRTCYFSNRARRGRNAEQRWRKTLTSLVQRYAVADFENGCLARPPHPKERKQIGTRIVYWIRFITPASWGFSPDPPHCWRPPLSGWFDEEQKQKPRFRLKKRRRQEEE